MKIVALLLLVQACNNSKPDTSMQDTIHVKRNETFEVKLAAVLGTGFRWMPADSAYQPFLRLDTTYTFQPKDIDGEPEMQVFVFRGLKKGETTLHFVYKRSWKKKDPPDKQRKYTVIIE